MAEPEKIDLSKLVWSEKKIYSSKVVFKLCTPYELFVLTFNQKFKGSYSRKLK